MKSPQIKWNSLKAPVNTRIMMIQTDYSAKFLTKDSQTKLGGDKRKHSNKTI